MAISENVTTRLRLNTIPRGHDLDGYLFADEAHARTWLAQGFVEDKRHSVSLVDIKQSRKCVDCGSTRRAVVKVHWTKKPSAFLATPEAAGGERGKS